MAVCGRDLYPEPDGVLVVDHEVVDVHGVAAVQIAFDPHSGECCVVVGVEVDAAVVIVPPRVGSDDVRCESPCSLAAGP